jgi:TetR/AcrR family transcriptional repressor of nem operon
MPRTKEYDREKLLGIATDTFLERGYKGTSMNDLVEMTGVHRRSLYTEFKNKNTLFLACIDTYLNNPMNSAGFLLEEPRGITNIKNFFRHRIQYASSGNCKGCLLVNSAVEKGNLSPAVEEKVFQSFKGLEKEFYTCLQAAETNGELSEGANCLTLAKYLMCFLEGLMVMGKTNPSKKALDSVFDSVLRAL